LKKLSRHGIHKGPAEDTRAFLGRVSTRDFPQSEELSNIVELYNRIKYGRQDSSQEALNHMRSMINSFQA
jgi:hypothetical protein